MPTAGSSNGFYHRRIDSSLLNTRSLPQQVEYRISLSVEDQQVAEKIPARRQYRFDPRPRRSAAQGGSCREGPVRLKDLRNGGFYLLVALPVDIPAILRTNSFRSSISYWLVMAICSMIGEPPP